MRSRLKDFGLFYLTLILAIATIFVFYLLAQNKDKVLTFAMLDVGQGDALFIESPTGVQVLVDGGPKNNILQALPQVMPFWDKTLNALIITNPDADHIGGFGSILDTYKVDMVFEPGTHNGSLLYKNIYKKIKEKDIAHILLRRGMRIDMGGEVYLDVLFPDREVFDWSTNDGSAVMRLVYGDQSILLSGDATVKTESLVVANNPKEILDSDILKVGHHGSRTSTSANFVETVTPMYALISSGEGNSYGHPHSEVLNTLANSKAQIMSTDELGNIIFKCAKIGECKIKKSKN
ncbi:MAG: ComEC/Rec2 family competence protein [Candidatus Paceibacteria bacterium]